MKFRFMDNIQEDVAKSSMEIYSNTRVLVIDCKSVIDYAQDTITLDLGKNRVRITGKNLVCDSFVFNQTDVTGIIEKIEFF